MCEAGEAGDERVGLEEEEVVERFLGRNARIECEPCVGGRGRRAELSSSRRQQRAHVVPFRTPVATHLCRLSFLQTLPHTFVSAVVSCSPTSADATARRARV